MRNVHRLHEKTQFQSWLCYSFIVTLNTSLQALCLGFLLWKLGVIVLTLQEAYDEITVMKKPSMQQECNIC